MSDFLPQLDGFAGIASLINSLILWPIVRSLKSVDKGHDRRLAVLEARRLAKAKRPTAKKQRRR